MLFIFPVPCYLYLLECYLSLLMNWRLLTESLLPNCIDTKGCHKHTSAISIDLTTDWPELYITNLHYCWLVFNRSQTNDSSLRLTYYFALDFERFFYSGKFFLNACWIMCKSDDVDFEVGPPAKAWNVAKKDQTNWYALCISQDCIMVNYYHWPLWKKATLSWTN